MTGVDIPDTLVSLTRITAHGAAQIHSQISLCLHVVPTTAAGLTTVGVLITLYVAIGLERRSAEALHSASGICTTAGHSAVAERLVLIMLFTALRDMQWRRWRFVIAIVVTGLVFAMTLVLTGLANGFRVEDERTVDSLGVDMFLIKSGATGPFLGSAPFPEAELQMVAGDPGCCGRGSPRRTRGRHSGTATRRTQRPCSAHRRAVRACRRCRRAGHRQAPTSWPCRARLAATLANELEVGSRKLLIVGIVNNSTSLAKTPNLFVTTEGVQQLEYDGQPLISAIGIRGTLSQVPDGYRVVNRTLRSTT